MVRFENGTLIAAHPVLEALNNAGFVLTTDEHSRRNTGHEHEARPLSSNPPALGVQAVKAGKSVCFTDLAELIGSLARSEREGRPQECIRFFCKPSLLIVDEIGYLPVVQGGGNLFFQFVNAG